MRRNWQAGSPTWLVRQPWLEACIDDVPLLVNQSRAKSYHHKTVRIDGLKSESQIAVVKDEGKPIAERRIANDQLADFTTQDACSEAANEASRHHFTIYDTHPEVT